MFDGVAYHQHNCKFEAGYDSSISYYRNSRHKLPVLSLAACLSSNFGKPMDCSHHFHRGCYAGFRPTLCLYFTKK